MAIGIFTILNNMGFLSYLILKQSLIELSRNIIIGYEEQKKYLILEFLDRIGIFRVPDVNDVFAI